MNMSVATNPILSPYEGLAYSIKLFIFANMFSFLVLIDAQNISR